MKNSNISFIWGVGVGSLVVVLLCLASLIGGTISYFVFSNALQSDGVVTKTIDAKKGWQSTGVRVTKGVEFQITVIEGQWTNWSGEQPPNSGEGSGYVCAGAMPAEDCVEPLPDFPAGGLIGRVGGDVFSVGEGVIKTIHQDGILYLRINDADVGLHDNAGQLKVFVEVLND